MPARQPLPDANDPDGADMAPSAPRAAPVGEAEAAEAAETGGAAKAANAPAAAVLSPQQHGMLLAGRALPQQAMAILDALPAVEAGFMLGAWKGCGFATGHPLDGVLQACHWWGKRFDSAEHVHPLVFSTLAGGTVCINPGWARPALPLIGRVPLPRSAAAGRVVQALLPLLATRRSRARLRMTVYRGVCTATMVYDQLPILDVFRKLDDDTVFAVMDLKGMGEPFFFMLRRHAARHPEPRAIRTPWPQRGM